MSGMFWIALELSISKIGFNIMFSLTVKKLDAFKFDEVAESDNTGLALYISDFLLSCCVPILNDRRQLGVQRLRRRSGISLFKSFPTDFFVMREVL